MKKTYYYHDMKNDDFASTNIKAIQLPDGYKYIDKNIFYRIGETIIRWIAFPIIFLILKVTYLIRVKNRKVLKKKQRTSRSVDNIKRVRIPCKSHSQSRSQSAKGYRYEGKKDSRTETD